MKFVLTLGAAAILATIGAVPFSWAQTNDPTTSSSPMGQQDSTQSNSTTQEGTQNEITGRGMMGGGMMHGGMMGDRGDSYHHMGRGGRAAQGGAVFRFRHGDDVVDIRCPRDEELSSCVQGAIRLIREIKTMQVTSGVTAPSTAPSSNPSGTVTPNSATKPPGQ